MADSTLVQLWSIQPSEKQIAPNPEDLTACPLHQLLLSRWFVHYVASVIIKVPASEPRVKNEALIPLYNRLRSLLVHLENVLRERNIGVPTYQPLGPGWEAEAAINADTLRAELLPNLDEGTNQYINASCATLNEGTRHWSSCVAYLAVAAELYLRPTLLGVAMTSSPRVQPPVDSAIAQYFRCFCDNATVNINHIRVLMEEALRMRDDPATGWKEAEAKDMTSDLVSRWVGSAAPA